MTWSYSFSTEFIYLGHSLQNSRDCQIMSMWAMRRKLTKFHEYKVPKRKISLCFVNPFNVMVISLSKVTNDGHLLLCNTKKHVSLMLIFIIVLHIISDCYSWGRILTPNVIYQHFKTLVYDQHHYSCSNNPTSSSSRMTSLYVSIGAWMNLSLL